MRALWWEANDKKLSFVEDAVEPTVTKPDEVKVKVAFSGVCGSDFHFMGGEMGKFSTKPDGVVLGHEFSGTVVEVGTGVENIKVGDEVSVDPNFCCENCVWHEEKKPQFCERNVTVGVKQNGGWAEFCVVPNKLVYKLPETVSLDGGALAEPYSCVLRGWKLMDQLPMKTAKVLIQGAGIIGSMFACLFHVKGYNNVTICEPHEGRRNTCSGLGFGYDVIHSQELDLLMAGKDADTHGFDVIFDCTGNCKAVQKTISLARRGAFISMFGCCPAGEKIEIEPFQIYWKELKISGSFINPFCFEEAVGMLKILNEKNLLDLNKIGVKIFELSDFEAAFASLKRGDAAKAMFKM
uniref:D-arabinitol dehydrogenase 1-like n=1 Tax=Styela clava TaxID=7725 RepID=UPI0019396FA4|nr:D-arabinitol dehydrogenase 1-like [Styela clava]